MELRGSWQQRVFHLIPKLNRCIWKLVNHFVEFRRVAFMSEGQLNQRTENSFHAQRQDHIENEELPLRSIWNVISSSAWMVHRADVVQILNILKGSTLAFLEHVKAAMFNELSDNF